jgi:hypothetical protein
MDVNSLEFIGVTPNLKNHIIENKIIEIIVEKVRAVPQFETLKRNMDLVLFICDIIENLVFENNIKSKYKPKGYKLQIAQTIFDRLSWNKPEDKDFLNNAVAFLHSSGRIRKISFVKRILAFGKRFLTSNVKQT